MKDSKKIAQILYGTYEGKMQEAGLLDKKDGETPIGKLSKKEQKVWLGMGRVFAAALERERLQGRDALSMEIMQRPEPVGESVDYIRAWRDYHTQVKEQLLKIQAETDKASN